MILLNFSTPFKSIQKAQAEACLHEPITREITVQFRVDIDQAMEPQFKKGLSKLQLSDEELRSEPVVVCLPPQNYLSAMLLVELRRRMGYYPRVIRLRLSVAGLLPFNEVAEIIDLQAIEDNF